MLRQFRAGKLASRRKELKMEFENGWHFFLPRRLHYPLHLNIAAEIERKVMTFIW